MSTAAINVTVLVALHFAVLWVADRINRRERTARIKYLREMRRRHFAEVTQQFPGAISPR